MSTEQKDGDAPGDGRGDALTEALDDAADDALDETDVDPTGNVLRNDPVERMEDAAVEHGSTGSGTDGRS